MKKRSMEERALQRKERKREREQQRERHAERAVFRVVLSRNNEELIMKLNTSVFRPQTELQT